jgi:hypothetical protein
LTIPFHVEKNIYLCTLEKLRMEKDLTVKSLDTSKLATNREILDKVLHDAQLTELIQLASRLKIQPHLLNAVYNGRLDMSKGLAHAINAIYPKIAVKWLLSGASKIKTPDDGDAASQPAAKRKYTKRKIKLQPPKEKKVKPVAVKAVEKTVMQESTPVNSVKPVKPKVEKAVVVRKKPLKLPVTPSVANRSLQSSSNLDTLMSYQETLISNMEKLVNTHLHLVELVAGMIKK